ncbi:MAG: Membrane-associated zinc metalloprotease [Devosia sp.]|nr:Membrane-associated zinc metalloprotease [Devosia sp.]
MRSGSRVAKLRRLLLFEISWPLVYALPAFLVVLTVIVFVHEMGHYLVARWNGIAIHTFSLGFGPEAIGRTDRYGTRWRLSWIPLGGYVRFVGDMNATSATVDADLVANASPELAKRLFVNKNVWQRMAVVVAGPATNIVFTFIVLYALLIGFGRYEITPVIGEIVVGSVAEAAGIVPGDRVLSVDGYTVRSFDDFQRLVATAPQRPVTIALSGAGGERVLTVVPELAEITDQFGNTHKIGRVGVKRTAGSEDVTLFRPSPIEAVGMTFEEVKFLIDRTIAFLGDFFVGRGQIEQLGGPVKVAKISGEMASLGVMRLISLMALLSLNIGILNLLPVPMLDGGHLVYYAAEAIRGKPLSQRVQEIGYRFGFAVVVTLMVFTLLNDTIFEAIRHFS